eukprot:10744248-Prorocentrum_lima.AAC.1
MHICATDLSLPEQSWGEGYAGTNKGTAIGPIAVDNVDNEWCELVKTKKSIYGVHRVAVGGDGRGATSWEGHQWKLINQCVP